MDSTSAAPRAPVRATPQKPRPDLFVRNHEASLAELMADPIMTILMASDGVVPQSLNDDLDAARARLVA